MSAGKDDSVVPGAPETTPAWIRAARPPTPPEFHPWLSGAESEGATLPSVEELEAWAEEALDRSVTAGADRAFHLLAADAFLTWACEAALHGDRPGVTLTELARRVAERGGAPGPPESPER